MLQVEASAVALPLHLKIQLTPEGLEGRSGRVESIEWWRTRWLEIRDGPGTAR